MAPLKYHQVRDIALWSVLICAIASSLLLQGPLILKATREPPLLFNTKNNPADGEQGTPELHAAAAAAAAQHGQQQQPQPQQRRFQPQGQAHYGFVQFSAYRRSARTLFVLGVTSVAVRAYDAPAQECVWEATAPNGSVVAVTAPPPVLTYIDFDENGALYVPVLVNCTFEQEVGGAGQGGTLKLAVGGAGGRGRTTLTAALTEPAAGTAPPPLPAASLSQEQQQKEERYEYAFCGPPIHSTVRADWILHWLVYHAALWERRVHFFFYNVGGLLPHHHPLLRRAGGGALTVTDVSAERDFPSWYYHQALLANDCLHRSFAAGARWTFFHDLDEFLVVPPPATLAGLLARHSDAPWITFGSLPVSHSHCVDVQEGDSGAGDGEEGMLWPVQRMWWRDAVPECMHPERDPWVCTQAPGRRKYVVNPRLVVATGVHRVAVPAAGGVDLNASVARIHHYHGVLAPAVELCHHSVNLSHPLEHLDWLMPGFAKYVQDTAVSELLQRARAQAD